MLLNIHVLMWKGGLGYSFRMDEECEVAYTN